MKGEIWRGSFQEKEGELGRFCSEKELGKFKKSKKGPKKGSAESKVVGRGGGDHE